MLKAGVGAIKGTFKGEVRLEDMRPPEHYRIVVEGKGAVGFAKGSADFDLIDDDGGTLINYSGELQIGGTIAGVGQRMIEAAAKMMAARFFAALEAEVTVTAAARLSIVLLLSNTSEKSLRSSPINRTIRNLDPTF